MINMMTKSAFKLLIPHQPSRPFVNAADIYTTSIGFLNSHFRNPLSQLEFRFHRPLGSYVSAHLDDKQPASPMDSELQFVVEGTRYWLGLCNQSQELEFDELYTLDESQIKSSILRKGEELRFAMSAGPSNVHQLSAAIKYACPQWPKEPSRVRNIRLKFKRDVQTVNIEDLSWRIQPRESFNVTTYFLNDEPFGEAVHFFLEEPKP